MTSLLDRRGWVLANPEWFMNEVVFYRENQKYIHNHQKILVWKLDDQEGKAVVT